MDFFQMRRVNPMNTYNYESQMAYGQSMTGTNILKNLYDVQNGGWESGNLCMMQPFVPKPNDVQSMVRYGVKTNNVFPGNENKFGFVSRTYGQMPGIPEKEVVKGRNNHLSRVLYSIGM